MSIIHPDYLFLNTDLVDETWTLFKQDGLNTEKIKEISAKASVKAKFGIGKIWQWLTTDLNLEAGGQYEGSTSKKYLYTSFLRALMLEELIPEVHQDMTSPQQLSSVASGTYMSFNCTNLIIIPIPTFAAYKGMELVAAHASGLDLEEKSDARNAHILSLIENLTSANSKKSLTLSAMLNDEDGNETVYGQIWDELAQEIANALIVSNDDLYLLACQPLDEADLLIISFIEEKFFKPHLAPYTAGRKLKIFGRKTHLRPSENLGSVLGLNAISICLE